MKNFEIVNTRSGHSFGTWEAMSAQAALDAYAYDAGHVDFADACRVASGDDIEAREVEVSIDDDLCERWLGRDWPSSTSPAEAMRIASACQAKRDAGDSRDYTAVLADVVG